jgi:putative ATP-dependent endonuclease of the OLD family
MTDTAPSAKPPTPAIYALAIERFRGITTLQWKPSRGVNVILGGGDVGKTTILEAIALLLSPVNPTTLPIPTITTEISKPGSPSRLFCPCRPLPE